MSPSIARKPKAHAARDRPLAASHEAPRMHSHGNPPPFIKKPRISIRPNLALASHPCIVHIRILLPPNAARSGSDYYSVRIIEHSRVLFHERAPAGTPATSSHQPTHLMSHTPSTGKRLPYATIDRQNLRTKEVPNKRMVPV